MRRLYFVGLLLLAGCQSVAGPLVPQRPIRVDDPCVAVEEQKRRGRSRLALPDESNLVVNDPGLTLPGWNGH